MKQSAKDQFFGIDLGTTNSIIAWGQVARHGSTFKVNPRTVEIPQGPYRFDFLPSVVYFDKNRGMLVGRQAKDMTQDAERVCRSVKLKLGTKTRYRRGGQVYTPTEISAIVLGRLRAAAQKARNCGVIQDVVLTVPASFDTDKRVETINAARVAFYDENSTLSNLSVHLLDEPTAALLAFLDDQKSADEYDRGIVDLSEPRNVLIFDFGGGTLDVSIVQVEEGGKAGFHIVPLGLSRYTELGGDDLDLHLGVHFLMAYAQAQGVDLTEVSAHTLRLARRRFQDIAEKAKIDLAEQVQSAMSFGSGAGATPNVKVDVEYMSLGLPDLGDAPFRYSLSAAEFTDVLSRFLAEDSPEGIPAQLADTLSRSGLSRQDVDFVLLVGGSSQLWCVRDALRSFFGFHATDGRLLEVLDPMRAVARGAVIQNHFLASGGQDGIGVTPTLAESIKLLVTDAEEHDAFVTLIHAGEFLPIRRDEIKTFSISTPGRGEKRLALRIFRGDGAARDHLTELKSKVVTFDEPQDRRERLVCSCDMSADKILRFRAFVESRAEQHFELSVDDGLLNDSAVAEVRGRLFP